MEPASDSQPTGWQQAVAAAFLGYFVCYIGSCDRLGAQRRTGGKFLVIKWVKRFLYKKNCAQIDHLKIKIQKKRMRLYVIFCSVVCSADRLSSFDCWRSFSSLFPFVWLGEGSSPPADAGNETKHNTSTQQIFGCGQAARPFRSAISEIFSAAGSKRREDGCPPHERKDARTFL